VYSESQAGKVRVEAVSVSSRAAKARVGLNIGRKVSTGGGKAGRGIRYLWGAVVDAKGQKNSVAEWVRISMSPGIKSGK